MDITPRDGGGSHVSVTWDRTAATGTPGGVGWARTPPEFLGPGAEVATTIDEIGELRNRCRRS